MGLLLLVTNNDDFILKGAGTTYTINRTTHRSNQYRNAQKEEDQVHDNGELSYLAVRATKRGPSMITKTTGTQRDKCKPPRREDDRNRESILETIGNK